MHGNGFRGNGRVRSRRSSRIRGLQVPSPYPVLRQEQRRKTAGMGSRAGHRAGTERPVDQIAPGHRIFYGARKSQLHEQPAHVARRDEQPETPGPLVQIEPDRIARRDSATRSADTQLREQPPHVARRIAEHGTGPLAVRHEQRRHDRRRRHYENRRIEQSEARNAQRLLPEYQRTRRDEQPESQETRFRHVLPYALGRPDSDRAYRSEP